MLDTIFQLHRKIMYLKPLYLSKILINFLIVCYRAFEFSYKIQKKAHFMQMKNYLVKFSEEFCLRLSLHKFQTKRKLRLRDLERAVIFGDMGL